jgi:phenazine biosynthesis protein
MAETDRIFSHDDDAVRMKNLAAVKAYFQLQEAARAARHTLFVDDCTWGLAYSETGGPQIVSGIDELKRMDERNVSRFPDWKWTDVRIFHTQDPNYFWVECYGSGQALFPDYPPVIHSAHFVHSFEMTDGKIKHYREFFNPIKELKDFGLEVPVLKRG